MVPGFFFQLCPAQAKEGEVKKEETSLGKGQDNRDKMELMPKVIRAEEGREYLQEVSSVIMTSNSHLAFVIDFKRFSKTLTYFIFATILGKYYSPIL